MAASFVEFRLAADGGDLLDRALAEALDAGASGAAEEEPGRNTVYAPAGRAAAVGRALREVAARAGGRLRVEGPRPVAARDWGETWREGFEARVLPGPLVVRPDFVAPPPEERSGAPVVRIEPGQAFGTGAHESTRLLLELLCGPVARRVPDSRVLDVGTGSGILALVALRLGARRAVGLDLDPRATREARQNARRNRLSDRLDLLTGGVDALAPTPFELILANLLRRELEPLLPALGRRLAPDGRLLLAGLIEDDLPCLAPRLAETGLAPLAEVSAPDPSGPPPAPPGSVS